MDSIITLPHSNKVIDMEVSRVEIRTDDVILRIHRRSGKKFVVLVNPEDETLFRRAFLTREIPNDIQSHILITPSETIIVKLTRSVLDHLQQIICDMTGITNHETRIFLEKEETHTYCDLHLIDLYEIGFFSSHPMEEYELFFMGGIIRASVPLFRYSQTVLTPDMVHFFYTHGKFSLVVRLHALLTHLPIYETDCTRHVMDMIQSLPLLDPTVHATVWKHSYSLNCALHDLDQSKFRKSWPVYRFLLALNGILDFFNEYRFTPYHVAVSVLRSPA